MAKKLSEIYAPKPKDEKAFVAKHTIKKTTDKSPATKEDARFKGTNVKTFDRTAKRMGYNPGADEKAYGVVPGTPSPTDQKTVTAIAPYTIKMGEEAHIQIGEDVIVIKFDTETKKLEKQILKSKKGDASDDTQKSFKEPIDKMKEGLEEAKSGWRLNSHTHEVVAPNGEVSARLRVGKNNGIALDHKGKEIDHSSGTALHDAVAMAHYRSKGNDFPAHHIATELHYLSGKDFSDHTVKSVKKIKETDELSEANYINKAKKNAYIKSIGKDKADRPNPTAAKKAGRAELRKEDFEINDDNIDILIDLIDEFLTSEVE